MAVVPFRIDPSVAPLLRIGLVEAHGVQVDAAGAPLREEIVEVSRALRDRYAGREPSQIEGLAAARELYRRVGIDPTKLRPSSEALLRRVLRGDELPVVNSLVDTSNLCSLEFLLPIGLHDLGRVEGTLLLRRGKTGEGYEAIGKGWYSVEERLTLADERGPCGTPTSDSRRTMITSDTTRCLMVIYAPQSVAPQVMEGHVRKAAGRIERYNGGRIEGTDVLPR